MKNNLWEFTKYAYKMTFKYLPRIFFAPIVGAARETWNAVSQLHAEIDRFDEKRKQRVAGGR